MDKETQQQIFETRSGNIRSLMNGVEQDAPLWSDDDLGAILKHQWCSPLSVDLSQLSDVDAARIRMLSESKGLVLKSFGDLLDHPHPPPALLEMTKEYAKRCLVSPLAPIPHDIARVLYFCCIAAALARCNKRISSLNDEQLIAGLRWARSRPWIGSEMDLVLREGELTVDPQSHREAL